MNHACTCNDSNRGNFSRQGNRHLQTAFAEIARAIGAELDPNQRIASLWYGDVFIAHSGVKSGDRFDQGRPLSIIYIDTPGNAPLAGLDDKPIPPGYYVARSFLKDSKGLPGDIELQDRSGQTVAKLIRDDNGSGQCGQLDAHTCDNASNATISYGDCEICFFWDCDSLCHRYCLKIPFCDLLTGALSDELVALASERRPCPYCKELILPDAIKCRYCQSHVAQHAETGCGCHNGPVQHPVPSAFVPPGASAMMAPASGPMGIGGRNAPTWGGLPGGTALYSYCFRGTLYCVDAMPDGSRTHYACGSCPLWA